MDIKPPYGLVYGPHESIRLGLSLGIDLTPMTCNFDCVYCERGRTLIKIRDPSEFRNRVCEEKFVKELSRGLSRVGKRKLDSITFSGTGEPTLEPRIKRFIEVTKGESSIPVRVITNSSLLARSEIRRGLSDTDEIIVKMNTASNSIFWSMHRPADRGLSADKIVEGVRELVDEGRTEVTVEVLLVSSSPGGPITNDSKKEVDRIAGILERIRPAKVQIHTVRRKPSHPLVGPVSREFLQWSIGEFRGRLGRENVQVFT